MNEQEKAFLHSIPAARRLRGRQTESEVVLWEALRNRRLHGLKFRRQHAIGRFVVDFFCDDARLIVEIDGGIHLDPEQQMQDRVRQSELEAKDFVFVRVSDTDVIERLPQVLERIDSAIRHRGLHSTASTLPLPQRRERGQGGEGCA